MFKDVLTSFAIVISIVLASLVITGALKIPVAMELGLERLMSASCQPPAPSDLPSNAGALVTMDVRKSDSGRTLVSASPTDWAAQVIPSFVASTDRARDLVVYVHGFNTSAAEAGCVGQVLRVDLANLPQYRQHYGPDVLVFTWPGQFGAFDFSGAQGNAALSARYLAAVLRASFDRPVYLIAHSLGAKVVMEAVSALHQAAARPPVRGILLVEGAIPATSVRTWTSKMTIRFPAAELWSRRDSKPQPIEENSVGTGEYVAAASEAEHFVVTTARGDTVLGQAYSLDELFSPDGTNRPLVPSSLGQAPRTLPQTLAIGSPFPTNPIYVRWDEELKEPTPAFAPVGNFSYPQSPTPTLKSPNPARVIQSTEWTFNFTVPHRSFHELRLSDIRWRPFYYWHAPLNDPLMRREVLARAWAIYVPVSSL